jgi:hypothetical protein
MINWCDTYFVPLSNECPVTEVKYNILSLGTCLEPFYSKMNHSCLPNAYWCFNGREIQVRAQQDIEAGQELFITYTGGDTYERRKKQLWEGWGFKCRCQICTSEERGPEGRLKAVLDKLLHKATAAEEDGALKLRYAMKGARVLSKKLPSGVETWEMRQFYSQVYKAHRLNKSASEMLKTWLTFYYRIQPYQQQKSAPLDRTSHLSLLIALTDHKLVSAEGLKEYADELKNLVANVYPFLRGNLIRELERWYGGDSDIAKHESDLYIQKLGDAAFKEDCGRRGENGEYLPMVRSKKSKQEFLTRINALLAYFSLDALSEEDLFR